MFEIFLVLQHQGLQFAVIVTAIKLSKISAGLESPPVKSVGWWFKPLLPQFSTPMISTLLGPVDQSWFSANPRLKFN